MPRLARFVVVLSFVATACGGGGDAGPFGRDAFAIVANSDLAVGTERVLVAISAPTGERLASPDIPVRVRAWPEGAENRRIERAADFVWAIPDVSGMYRAQLTFDTPGIWELEVVPEGGPGPPPVPFSVLERPSTIAPGEPAPACDSVTAADSPIAEITTDPDPDPRFYELSVADAVTSGRPSVIAFATPAFCRTATCGPTMETLRAMAPAHPDVDWVHVEVYTNLDTPDDLEVVPAVEEWGLRTEPWVFVVDTDGIVIARFEGVITAAEITAALGR